MRAVVAASAWPSHLAMTAIGTPRRCSAVPHEWRTTGIKVTANSTLLIPTTGAEVQDLYAIVGTGTGTVVFLHP
jgi:hypothetical protein